MPLEKSKESTSTLTPKKFSSSLQPREKVAQREMLMATLDLLPSETLNPTVRGKQTRSNKQKIWQR
jgi:hypothetical protein